MPIYKTVSTLMHVKGDLTIIRVVEAPNVATARSHVAKDVIKVEICDTAEAMRLAGEGIKLEKV